MTIETIKKYNTGYTQVLNAVLYDKSLSLRAKGLYAYLFSKPDGWTFHMETMTSELAESKSQLYAAIKELIDCGYIIRNQVNENGVFGGITYEFVDINNRIRKKPCAEKTVCGKTATHNNTDNLNNTDLCSKTYNSILCQKSFENFWKNYIPVKCDGKAVAKGSKSVAFKKFVKILKSGVKLNDIISGLQNYLKYCRENNQLTCSAPVFLNQRRWEDDYNAAAVNSTYSGRERQQSKSVLEIYSEVAAEYDKKGLLY